MPDFRVQRGTVDFGVGSSPVTVTLPVAEDPRFAFPRLTSVLHGSGGRVTTSPTGLGNNDMSGRISNWTGSSFELFKPATAEADAHRYAWEIWSCGPMDAALRPLHGFEVLEVDFFGLGSGVTSASTTGLGADAQTIVFPTGHSGRATTQSHSDVCATLALSGGEVVATRHGSGSTASIGYAAVRMGSAWTVSQNLTLAMTVGGAELALSGAGTAPWSQKFATISHRVQAGANDVRDYGILARADYSDDSQLLCRLEPGANLPAVGGYEVVAHVAHHPKLFVEHASSLLYSPQWQRGSSTPLTVTPDLGSAGVIATSSTDTGVQAPRGHWWYQLRSTGVFHDRGRDGVTSDHALQVVHFFTLDRGGAVNEALGGFVNPSPLR